MQMQARRLCEAFSRANARVALPGGAAESDIDDLNVAFPELHMPTELIALLSVVNGGELDLFITGIGRLLSAAQIVEETRSRSELGSDIAFCQAWVVFTAEGWSHGAVIAGAAPRERSAVLDLSYGNQAYPVVTSSLTALIAASADAWEMGIHPSQTWNETEEGQRAYRETARARRDLLAQRSGEFPSTDGLTAADCVAEWRRAWPVSWPGRGEPDYMTVYSPDALENVLATPGSHRVIEVTIAESRARWTRVREPASKRDVWLALPPALAEGHDVRPGSLLRFSVLHEHPPLAPTDVPEDGPTQGLRVTGVFEPEE
ncbi:MAG: hypothetical protein JWL77_6994 [Chthonomonadaceae bacterium]|nr:hypothetical protein [Chthonomonadaceae bacterium]